MGGRATCSHDSCVVRRGAVRRLYFGAIFLASNVLHRHGCPAHDADGSPVGAARAAGAPWRPVVAGRRQAKGSRSSPADTGGYIGAAPGAELWDCYSFRRAAGSWGVSGAVLLDRFAGAHRSGCTGGASFRHDRGPRGRCGVAIDWGGVCGK